MEGSWVRMSKGLRGGCDPYSDTTAVFSPQNTAPGVREEQGKERRQVVSASRTRKGPPHLVLERGSWVRLLREGDAEGGRQPVAQVHPVAPHCASSAPSGGSCPAGGGAAPLPPPSTGLFAAAAKGEERLLLLLGRQIHRLCCLAAVPEPVGGLLQGGNWL